MIFQPGDIILNGKYRVEALVVEGAFGEVYRATHLRLNLERAVKVLHRGMPGVGSEVFSDCRERFALEARLGAVLDHPNIIKVYDFEEEGGNLFLVMEYAPGGSLRDLLDRQGTLSVDEAVRMALDVCDGLAAMFEQVQAVHRDLKPSNILFDANGRAKIADLGLAQVPGGGSLRSLASLASAHPGTSVARVSTAAPAATIAPSAAAPTVTTTPSPRATATSTTYPTPAYTRTPMPSSTPSATSVPPSRTATAAIAPGPTSTGEPYEFGAPGLVSPGNGAVVEGGQDVVLSWTSVGLLGPDTWYVVRIWSEDASVPTPPAGWTRKTSWRIPASFHPGDGSSLATFHWSVTVLRVMEGQTPEPLSPVSQEWGFTWK